MDFPHVQRRAQRAISDRMLERYPMSNSDLFSSDSSCEDEIVDLVYRNLRLKAPVKLPFRVENFGDENMPVARRPVDIRPQSVVDCAKCNQIRTNPRFRPSSFHSYGKLLNEQKMLAPDDESSDDDQVNAYQRPFRKHRRRTRLKTQPSGGAPQLLPDMNGRAAPVTPIRKSSMLSSTAPRASANQETAVVTPLKRIKRIRNNINADVEDKNIEHTGEKK